MYTVLLVDDDRYILHLCTAVLATTRRIYSKPRAEVRR